MADSVTVSIDAQNRLPELLREAKAGRDVFIEQKGETLVQLVWVALPPGPKQREFGQFKGKVHLSDDFGNPLPDNFWFGKKTS